MKKIKEMIFKTKFKELPAEIQLQIVSLSLLDLVLFIAGIATAIVSGSLEMLGYVALIFLGFTAYVLYFVYFFVSNKAIVYEGFITEIGDENENVLKKAAKGMLRKTFNIQTDDGDEYSVLKTSSKIKKKGSRVRVYTSAADVYQKSDGTKLINKVMYIEIIKK